MTDEKHASDACEQALEDVTAELYGELEPERRESLEAHLASCASCRETRAGREEARRLLDLWESEPVQAAPRGRRPWRAAAAGVIAAAIAFALLSLVGTEIDAGDGRLVVTFGTGQVHRARRTAVMAKQVVDERVNALRDNLSHILVRWDEVDAHRRDGLLEALDLRWKLERARTDHALQELRQTVRAETYEVNQALLNLVREDIQASRARTPR